MEGGHTIKTFGTAHKTHWAILFLLISGFILRIYDLGIQSFWFDEAISSTAAVAFLETGTPTFPSGLVYSRAILNTFLIALSFKIFGITEFAARLPSVMFGMLTILLVYLMGSKWGNHRIGLIAAVLVTFSVWEIAWSRQARMYQQLQFFYLLSLYLFYEYTRYKDPKWLMLLIFSVTGAVLSHVFGYALIPVFLLYLIISALKERRTLKDVDNRTIALFILACMALFGFVYNKGVITSVLNTGVNYYDTYIYLLKKDLGIFLFIAVPGGTVLVNRDWKKGLLLISALIIPLYFIFFHVLMLGTRYLYFVIPILFLLIGYFLDFVIEYSSGIFSRSEGVPNHSKTQPAPQVSTTRSFISSGKCASINRINRYLNSLPDMTSNISATTVTSIIVAFLLIFAMYFSPAFTFTPMEKYNLGVNAPQPDFKKAYSFVKEDMQPNDVIVSAWTPPALFYLGKSDYWLGFNVVGTGMDKFLVNNSSREVYTNATAIADVETFREVVDEHDRGWVVVDSLGWYKLRPSIKDFISGNLTCYMTTNDTRDAIKVYGWGK